MAKGNLVKSNGLICIITIFIIFISSSILFAEEMESPIDEPSKEVSTTTAHTTPVTKKLRRITVSGGSAFVDQVPGSAHYLSKEDLEKGNAGVDDIHKVLRQIPGVNITEEEGYGLRPNIGFRGTDTDRSSNITLMEDSVLIAPAPYSAPAAYYFPSVGRMEAIEITKGSGQIKYGPRTTGGSLNLLSTSIPDQLKLHSNVKFGQNNTQIAHIYGGKSFENAGFLLETYQANSDGFKDLDGGGDTGFDIADYLGKFRINTDKNAELYHELEFKIHNYDQSSEETYIGLTDEDFNATPFRRYAGSQLDNIEVDHEQYQLRHYGELDSGLDITTTAYINDTSRNWQKVENIDGNSIGSIFDNPELFTEELDWLKGEDSPDDAFGFRANNRKYRARGIQSIFGLELEHDQIQHDIEFGVRFHQDYEDRFQREDGYRMEGGKLIRTSISADGSNANRKSEAKAWAFHMQDIIGIDKWSITPGARYEIIDYVRRDWGKSDPERSGTELAENRTDLTAFIPGFGVRRELSDEVGAFVGVHKGFAPPGPQSSNDVDKEDSVNYEMGVDYKRESLKSEAIFFYNDYDNLLGKDTESSGGSGSGDQFNGGAATTYGIELSGSYDLVELKDDSTAANNFRLPVRATYTYTNSEFDSSFDSEFFGDVSSGDRIPYIPEHQFSTSVGVEVEKIGLYLNSHFVDSMPTLAANTESTQNKKTDSHVVFDLVGEYLAAEGLTLFATVENLFDQEYVVARRPAGARPGRPQTFMAGLKYTF